MCSCIRRVPGLSDSVKVKPKALCCFSARSVKLTVYPRVEVFELNFQAFQSDCLQSSHSAFPRVRCDALSPWYLTQVDGADPLITVSLLYLFPRTYRVSFWWASVVVVTCLCTEEWSVCAVLHASTHFSNKEKMKSSCVVIILCLSRRQTPADGAACCLHHVSSYATAHNKPSLIQHDTFSSLLCIKCAPYWITKDAACWRRSVCVWGGEIHPWL